MTPVSLDDLFEQQREIFRQQCDTLQKLHADLRERDLTIRKLEGDLAAALAAAREASAENEKTQQACREELRSRKEVEDRVRHKWTLALEEERMGRKEAEINLSAARRELEQCQREAQQLRDTMDLSDKVHTEAQEQLRREAQDAKDHLMRAEAERKKQTEQTQELLGIVKTLMNLSQSEQHTNSSGYSESSTKRESSSNLPITSPISPTQPIIDRHVKAIGLLKDRMRLPFPTSFEEVGVGSLRPTPSPTPINPTLPPKTLRSGSPGKLQLPRVVSRGPAITVPIKVKSEQDEEMVDASPRPTDDDNDSSPQTAPRRRRRRAMVDEDDYEDSADDNDEIAIGAERNRQLYSSRSMGGLKDVDMQTPDRRRRKEQPTSSRKRKVGMDPNSGDVHPRKMKR